VRVEIDEAWCDVEASGVDGLDRTRGGDVRLDRGDPAIGERDVADGIDAVSRVDDVSAFQQQLVRLRGLCQARGEQTEADGFRGTCHERRLWM
jgi:hypothetical protein